MTNRYGTFSADSNLPSKELRHGVLDSITGTEYDTVDLKTAEKLATLLNVPSDCRFNCRAKRKADYVAGYEQHQKNMSLPGLESAKTMHLCFEEYIGK
jgi:hypothetical protein